MTARLKYRPSPSGQPVSSYSIANTKVARAIAPAIAIPIEQCIGEVTTIGDGRQIGDQCGHKARVFRNHRCKRHQYQYNNPNYPTSNSYLRRLDERRVPNPSQMEARPDMLQIGASTPMGAPSRTTASAVRSHSSTPQQQYTSSSPQPQTYHEQPDRRRDVTPHPPGRMPLYTNTSTQASSAVSAANRSLGSNNLLNPPATEIQTPSEQPRRRRDGTTHLPGRVPSQTPTPTQASLSPHSASKQMLSYDDAHAFYVQPPNSINPAINDALQPSRRLQHGTPTPNPSHSTSRLNHDDTTRATSSNSEDSDRNHHHTPRPPSPSPENQAGASSQSSDSAPLRSNIRDSTNTSTPTPTPTTLSRNIDSHNRFRRSPSDRSDRSRLRAIEKYLHRLLRCLQRAGECPNCEPLGQDWIDIEPTSVPEPEGGPPVQEIIADFVYEYMGPEPPYNHPEEYAMELLRQGCDESERGKQFRESLRRRGLRTGE